MIIVGDIGGTHCRFALVQGNDGEFKNLKVLLSKDYKDFSSALSDYLNKIGNPGLSKGCFAVAGPIINGVCKVTNLPWVIDVQVIEKEFQIPKVFLINDLEAEAYSVSKLPKESFVTLSKNEQKYTGNRVIISPGTGLGEAGIFWDGAHYHPFACEGGNADFAPLSPLQLEFSAYLMQHYDHPSTERAVSGPGLQNIFNFLKDVKKREVPIELQKDVTDKSVMITKLALEQKAPICVETLDLFITILGQEASNCALKFMATGGVFLGGGIVPKILPKLKEDLFLDAFLNKGRFKYLLEQIPIFALDNKFSALFGASIYATTVKPGSP